MIIDVLVKNRKIEEYWIICDQNNNKLIKNTIHHKQRDFNTLNTAEAITVLELIEVLEKWGKYIEEELVIISINSNKIFKEIITELLKSNQYTQDISAEITQIKWIMNEIKYDIKFRLVNGYLSIIN